MDADAPSRPRTRLELPTREPPAQEPDEQDEQAKLRPSKEREHDAAACETPADERTERSAAACCIDPRDAGRFDPGSASDGSWTARDVQGRRLEPRQVRVLWELSRLGDATVAFSGVRRRLDLHPQALTRTLDRLVQADLVARTDDGYRLTDAGFRSVACCAGEAGPRTAPLFAAVVPPHLDPDDVADRLAGRWFQGLHWYGRADGPGEVTLAWLTDPDARIVRLRMVGGTLTVEAEVDPGQDGRPGVDDGTSGGDGTDRAPPRQAAAVLSGVRAVMGAVAELYDPPSTGPGTGANGDGGPDGPAA